MAKWMKAATISGVCLLALVLFTTGAMAFGVTYNVGNRVWLDLNNNGQQDANEPGINGAQVHLEGVKQNGEALVMDTVTAAVGNKAPVTTPAEPELYDGMGWYNFNLDPGTYTISVSLPGAAEDYVQTYDLDGLATPNAAAFTLSANRYDVDFGYSNQPEMKPLVTISGHVYYDCNANSILDDGETLLAASAISLYAGTNTSGTPLKTVTPCSNGLFSFTELEAGVYTVVETNQAGYTSTASLGGVGGAPVTDDVIVVAANQTGIVDYPDQDFLDTKTTPPSIDLEKIGPATAKIGQKITYHFTITNTGGVDLQNVTLNDPLLGGKILELATLAAGASYEFDKTYTITSTSTSSRTLGWSCTTGSTSFDLVNTATVTGKSVCGITVTDTDSCTTKVSPSTPGIDLIKTAPTAAKVGDTITYSFTITNTGGTTLTNITLTDEMLGGTILRLNSLAGGASYDFEKTYKVTSSSCDNSYDGCDYGGWGGCGWSCTSGGYGDRRTSRDGGRCGGGTQTTTCKLVNTATVTAYASCWTKVSDTASCTTVVSSTKSCSYGWDNGCGGSYGGGYNWGNDCWGGYNWGSWGCYSFGRSYGCLNW